MSRGSQLPADVPRHCTQSRRREQRGLAPRWSEKAGPKKEIESAIRLLGTGQKRGDPMEEATGRPCRG